MTEKKVVLPEAPASVTIKAVSAKGFDMMFTLRDADETALLARLVEYFKKLENEFNIQPTRKPKPNGNGSQNTVPPQPTGAPQPVAPQPTGEPLIDAMDLYFAAETMEATVTAGKQPLWKVKGGKFTEYGVTIWPEVLEAANLGGQDVSQVISLVGYLAYYELNENGNPKKVVNLSKA